MFGMFPFMFNKNNENSNRNNNLVDLSFFNNLFNDDFINNLIDEVMSSDFINDFINESSLDDYDIEFKDLGDYYLIKGYLPGLTAKDISIDFEKNKAILTIKKKQVYSNNSGNAMVTVVQSGGKLVKNFYIEEVDVTRLRASFDNNVLVIMMPKSKKLKDIEENNDNNDKIIDVENYKVE